MKTVDTAVGRIGRAAILSLAIAMLAGCGLSGGRDRTEDEAKEEGRLAQALRMVGAVRDAIDGKRPSPDTEAQHGAAGGDGPVPEALGRMLESMAGAAGGAASDNDVRTAEGIEQEGRDLEQIMRRMKETGDLSQAGEVMARMMQMTSAMQGMQEAEQGTQAVATGTVAGSTTSAAASERMRALGGIPVESTLTREQERALFAPQAWGEAP